MTVSRGQRWAVAAGVVLLLIAGGGAYVVLEHFERERWRAQTLVGRWRFVAFGDRDTGKVREIDARFYWALEYAAEGC